MSNLKKMFGVIMSATLVALSTGTAAMAQANPPPTELTSKTYEVTIRPGASYTVSALGFCISYAKPYPQDNVIFPGGRVNDQIVQVLDYAVSKKIITSTAVTDAAPYYQLELAVWKAADGNWHDWMNRGTVEAEKIYSDALKTPAPAIPANAFFSPAYSKTLEISVAPMRMISDSQSTGAPYLGETQVTIKNVSNKSVKVAIVSGALAGSTQANQQDLGVMFAGLHSVPNSGAQLDGMDETNGLWLFLVVSGVAVTAFATMNLMRKRQTAG